MKHTALTLFAAVLMGTVAIAQEWPQFRGPDGQGHSTERGVPLHWSATRNIVWKVPVPGRGWSSPIVASRRVWLTTATGGREGALRLLAYDVESGREALNVEIFRIGSANLLNDKNSHASPTPVADADRVYVHFGDEGTAAVTMDGKVVWKTRLRHRTQHGNGASPVIYGDLLIVNCDGADAAFVVALDKHSGKVRWKTWRRQPWSQAYTTPLVIRHGEQDQLVSVGASYAAAYEPQSGKEIWRVSYADGFSNVPRPVAGHGLVYIMTGFQQPSLLAIRPSGTGDVTQSHVAWSLNRGVSLTPSPLLVGDELYMVSDAGIVTCVDAKAGAIVWQHRLDGAFSASPVYADGRLYFQSEEGVTTVVVPGREFTVLSVNALDAPTLASMAVASGSMFLRTATHLYRIGGG
ncbi:MAG: PQQ-binding-like beta-propeller repeat protein [Vicinamibacterales bacterium]